MTDEQQEAVKAAEQAVATYEATPTEAFWQAMQSAVQHAWELLKPIVQEIVQLWQQIQDWFRPPRQPKPLYIPRDKRAWQHAQKQRAQIKRARRERAKQRTALFYQYRAR